MGGVELVRNALVRGGWAQANEKIARGRGCLRVSGRLLQEMNIGEADGCTKCGGGSCVGYGLFEVFAAKNGVVVGGVVC